METTPVVNNTAEVVPPQTENELRQRNVAKPTPTTNETTSIADNYKDDINHNGGGFYECNIW